MREIRFRAWDTENKEFIYEAQATYDNACTGLGSLHHESFQEVLEDDSLIVEQYTGLKDKNGKEIYEGDIIQEKGLLSLTCVEWNKNNARYMTRVLEESKCVSTTFYFDVIDALGCEVIGNIHENPELLEKK